MSLFPMADLMRHARENRYGVPAFNVNDTYSIAAAIAAAEEEDAPLILMGWEGELEGPNMVYFSSLAVGAAQKARVPVAIHLDHGTSFAWAQRAIQHGFTSVMIDSSMLPFDENVAVTRKVVEAAHACGVTVEAELGHIIGADVVLTEEQQRANMTDPGEAARFVEATGVDALAVAVGNAHGLYKYTPKLDLERLETIVQRVQCHVVMHGGSGTPSLPEAVQLGVTKINIGTDIQVAFRESVKQTLQQYSLENLDSTSILGPATQAMKQVMVDRIRLFSANGQGREADRFLRA
jgi:fructose-bisphosphate aldolase class II